MKALKITAISILILIVVVLAGVYIAIDTIARNVINSEGSAVLGVPAKVESVSLGVLFSDSNFSGLTIANPAGFKRPTFVQIDHAEISTGVGTLISSDIEIPLIKVQGMTVDLEQINERFNAEEIVANVGKNTASPDDTDDPISLNIKTLVIEDIHLTASGRIVNITGGHLDAKIPRLELHNLGTKTDGDQLAHQLVSMLLGVVMKHIADNPVKGLSSAAIGSIASAIESIPVLGHTQAGRTIGDTLRGASKQLNKGVGALGEGLDGVGTSIGKILGNDPDEDKKSE